MLKLLLAFFSGMVVMFLAVLLWSLCAMAKQTDDEIEMAEREKEEFQGLYCGGCSKKKTIEGRADKAW